MLGETPSMAQSLQLGSPPPIEQLAMLDVEVSTMADVRAALGAPQGRGAARMPDYPGFRETWAYEFMTMEGSDLGVFILVVFFDGERYDGYLWFDASQTMEPSP